MFLEYDGLFVTWMCALICCCYVSNPSSYLSGLFTPVALEGVLLHGKSSGNGLGRIVILQVTPMPFPIVFLFLCLFEIKTAKGKCSE